MTDHIDLFRAVEQGEITVVRRVLDETPEAVAARNEAGISLLMFALYNRENEIAELIRSRLDDTDIFEATALGDPGLVSARLRSDPGAVHTLSPDGFTPLHYACFFNKPDVAELLIGHDADVNAVTTNPARLRPIHSAAASRASGIVCLLLEAGADPNVQQVGGWTPLHSAALHNDREMLQSLLAFGARKTLKADDGQTAIDLARAKASADGLELLES